jgi:hypothetical protein
MKQTSNLARVNEPLSKSNHVSLSLQPSKSARKAAFRKERQKFDVTRSGEAHACVKKVNKPKSSSQKRNEWIGDARQESRQDAVLFVTRGNLECEGERGGNNNFPSVHIGPYEELLACSETFTERENYYVAGKKKQSDVLAAFELNCLQDFGLADHELIDQAFHQAATADPSEKGAKDADDSKYSELQNIPFKKLIFGDKNSITEYIDQAARGLNDILLKREGCNANELIEYLADWDGGSYESSTNGSFETGAKTGDSTIVSIDSCEYTVESDLSMSQCASGDQEIEVTIGKAAVDENEEVGSQSGGIVASSSSASVCTEKLRGSADQEPSINESEVQHFEIHLSTSSLNRIDEMSVKTETSKHDPSVATKNKNKISGLKSLLGFTKEKVEGDNKIQINPTREMIASELSMVSINHTPHDTQSETAPFHKQEEVMNDQESCSQCKSSNQRPKEPQLVENHVTKLIDVVGNLNRSNGVQHITLEGPVDAPHLGRGENPTASCNEVVEADPTSEPKPSEKELKDASNKAFAISLTPLSGLRSTNSYLSDISGSSEGSVKSVQSSSKQAQPSPSIITDPTQLKNHGIGLHHQKISQLDSTDTCLSDEEDSVKRGAATQWAQDLDWNAFIQDGIKSKSLVTAPIAPVAGISTQNERKMPTKMSMVKSFFGKKAKKQSSGENCRNEFLLRNSL